MSRAQRVFSTAAAAAVALTFLAAAGPKITDPAAFALAVYRYQMLPAGLVNLAAIYLPWIELMAAAAILLPAWRRPAAAILLAMLGIFTAAIAINMARGLNISCGCFGGSSDGIPMGWWNLLRNGALIALTLVLALRRRP